MTLVILKESHWKYKQKSDLVIKTKYWRRSRRKMNLHLKVVFVCIIFNLAASCGQRWLFIITFYHSGKSLAHWLCITRTIILYRKLLKVIVIMISIVLDTQYVNMTSYVQQVISDRYFKTIDKHSMWTGMGEEGKGTATSSMFMVRYYQDHQYHPQRYHCQYNQSHPHCYDHNEYIRWLVRICKFARPPPWLAGTGMASAGSSS